MYIRSIHHQLTESSAYYKAVTQPVSNFVGRHITSHLPEGLVTLVDRVAYAFEMVLPKMAVVASAASFAYFTGSPEMALAVFGALIWFSFDVANSLQFYPYDYLENLSSDTFKKEVDSMVVRKGLTDRILFYLTKPTANNNNVMAVGPAGSGKTSTALSLVRLIRSEDCPKELKDKKVFRVRIDKLFAHVQGPGDFEMRFLALLNAIQFDKDAILFIDEAHQLVDKRGNGGTSLSNLLKPFLSTGMHCLAATTKKEYVKHIVDDEGLEQRFNIVELPPLSQDTCIKILQRKFDGLSKNAAQTAIQEAQKLYPAKALPRSAIILLENTQHKTKTIPTSASIHEQARFERSSLGTLAPPAKKHRTHAIKV